MFLTELGALESCCYWKTTLLLQNRDVTLTAKYLVSIKINISTDILK